MSTELRSTLHDPADRVLIARLGPWEVRRHSEHDLRMYWLARHGGLHVQLWDPETGTSLLSPSRLSAGTWELRRTDGEAVRVREFPQLRERVPALPCPCCMQRLLQGWVQRPLQLMLLHGGVGAPGRPFPEA